MALSAFLKKPVLIRDLCVAPIGLHRSCTWSVVRNLNHVGKGAVVSSSQPQMLQHINKFSTSKQLMASHAGDHSTMWTVEKVITIALLGLIPASIAVPNKILDTATAVFLVMHMHWGLQAITGDYIRKAVFGPVLPKVTAVLVYVLSVVTLAGLLNITFNQAGIGSTVQGMLHIQSDYLRKSVVGATLEKLAVLLVHALSAVTLAGLLCLIYVLDTGLGEVIKSFWCMEAPLFRDDE